MQQSEHDDIPQRMRAVVSYGPEDYRLTDLPVPRPGPGEALLRVAAVGICASDLKCYHGAAKFWGDDSRPAWAETDVVPGHEFVGDIVALDDEARARWGVDVGDRVVAEQILPCGQCRYCERGQYWMCAVHDIFGFKRAAMGAMAEYVLLPARSLVHPISASVPPAHAAFAEPLSCALHAVERAGITFDDVVVVAGCGPIGLGMVAGAAAKNPAKVIALDMADDKLALARACGADLTLNINRDDVVGTVRELTGGYGADVYLEGTGHPSAVLQGLNLLRKLGTYVEYSVFGSDVTVDWSIISDDKELDVRGAHLGPHCWPAAIRMIESGRLPLERICTHQLPLDRFQEGLDLVADGSTSIKVSLLPS
ncbi:alcohol dehydrogenase catalytic domain-containing protein [Dactylosporangium sp. AC04546]|uniref:alcohol dehydrogenase catalytic domain-containing protein n=1 Tax=Dactylosporangium sp. AC04546 TaxID=2862460 RepID=UPI001EDDF08A|nr:alcohol dehydrogenase catalytic domain-containing protein [Dactylosporangium sp. AC04546]WVK88968.1 alcohol dehydrogenase catalytic domain-containing protein [Dactylosporangium sp. AC04546]